jgi:hypothetical protein
MMKKTLAICVILVFSMVIVGPAMAGRVLNRQINQQERIDQGIRSGELTGREVKVLEHEQWQIQKSKRRALSDGVVTPGEKIRLDTQQDKASARIYRLKHNVRQQP